MRISDWRSYVCSADLLDQQEHGQQVEGDGNENDCHPFSVAYPCAIDASRIRPPASAGIPWRPALRQPNCSTSPVRSNAAKYETRPSLIALTLNDRKSDVLEKRVSVSVEIGSCH